MLEMHLRKSEFTYSACEPFIKHKARIQEIKDILIKMNQRSLCST